MLEGEYIIWFGMSSKSNWDYNLPFGEHLYFFDLKEHLVVHLAEEVQIVGLVQFQWMHPIERCDYFLDIFSIILFIEINWKHIGIFQQ